MPENSAIFSLWSRSKATDREYLLISDVRKHEGPYFRAEETTRCPASILVPASGHPHSREGYLGVINAESKSADGFDELDLIALQTTASALQAVHEQLSAADALRRVLTLQSVPKGGGAQSKELFRKVLECVRDGFGYDSGILYEADEPHGLLRVQSLMGCEHLEGKEGALVTELSRRSFAGEIYLQKEPIFSKDPSTDDRVNKEGLEVFQIAGPMIGVPMLYGGRVVGRDVVLEWEWPHPC